MHDALTTDENNTLTTEEHIIHLQDKWWVHDALATSCDTGTITSSQSHTTDALLSLGRWVASRLATPCISNNRPGLARISLTWEQDALTATCYRNTIGGSQSRTWCSSTPGAMRFTSVHLLILPIGDDDLEFVLGQNMLWCCHQLGLCMSYSGVNIKLSVCGEYMQQMWIFTTLSLTLSLQWNFLFLQSCRRLYSAAIAIGWIQIAQLQ